MKKSTHFALLCVAALALAGCGAESGGTSDATPSAEATSAASSAAPSVEPTEEPSPTESAEAGADYTNEDLSALVSSLTDAQGQPLTVMPAEQLDQGIMLARTILENATISPEECNVFASENLQAPEGSTYAAGLSQAAEEMTQTTVTVIAVEDPAVMAEQITKSQDSIDQCTSFEVEFEGEVITSELQPLEVATDAETSIGALAVQTLGSSGETQSSMTVSAVQGNLTITAAKTGTEILPEAQAELEQLINDALAAAE
ncbi:MULTISPECIES: hypothetical protein [unclassified Arthrobacter]|uniref:hypothetical protein n=1 Tax=unclassified Arthrobacter TaxID=235627 RepID=UPI00149171DC|nr:MULTISPECIES: hypothetical protein [unclassified Arthrobacter]MBE0009149.1 hypothetical protein [Arthrobacter sp. AET 35A]NOJ63041.1 hypothetical protein [Arthrobacter sp. 147(2020)]